MASQSIHDFTVKDARGNNVDFSTYKGKVLLIVNVASKCGLTNSNYTELTKLYEKYSDQASYLNPTLQYQDARLGYDVEILDALRRVINRMEPDTIRAAAAVDEIKIFREGSQGFADRLAIHSRDKTKPGLEILAFPCNQFSEEEPGSNEEILEFVCTRFKAEFPIFDKIEVNGENVAPIYKFLKSSKGGISGDNIEWNFAKFLVDKDGNVVEFFGPWTSPLSIEEDIRKVLGVS